MRVLVTGANGFIGKNCIEQLHAKGYEVHAISTGKKSSETGVRWHQVNLLDHEKVRATLNSIKPSHLLHLAWCTEQGKYWTSPDNFTWVQASLNLIREFTDNGGIRLVTAGTCAEYEWGHGVCKENQTPLLPSTLYGTCKHALQLIQRSWSQQVGLSSAWGRVFSLYGPREDSRRLVASVIKALLHDREVSCSNPNLIRDYLHVEDVASAFVAILDSSIEGPINIGSGEGVKLSDVVVTIADKLNKLELIRLGGNQSLKFGGEPIRLIADIDRLSSIGWEKNLTLDHGLNNVIDWWKIQPD
jgi:nucleoside-diphosphate-sugar epimerase